MEDRQTDITHQVIYAIKRKRTDLEHQIQDLVDKFEKETKTTVTEIDLERGRFYGKATDTESYVTIKITLQI